LIGYLFLVNSNEMNRAKKWGSEACTEFTEVLQRREIADLFTVSGEQSHQKIWACKIQSPTARLFSHVAEALAKALFLLWQWQKKRSWLSQDYLHLTDFS